MALAIVCGSSWFVKSGLVRCDGPFPVFLVLQLACQCILVECSRTRSAEPQDELPRESGNWYRRSLVADSGTNISTRVKLVT